ncbi:MurR/RpiR family transcriptional regulator [Lampropedia aestuarii]|uniref:MurR/RpiR family transcriptional regulator n=1 Tax=Lampropedia aestuarii TaxID=2562762 RepID=UPI00246881DF|nr:MurR/RpiR family transcriptional regulator [Lampropedia aestuarii]MDH5858692.1 MurR/RpiR family transcriptional regulator [Lampropedia aestuarii]
MSNGPTTPNLNELSPELQRAARWMQTHSSDVAMHSLRECARRAEISPSTFSRLARTLGFENFEAMKQQYRQQLQESASFFSKGQQLQTSARKQGEWLEDIANSQMQNVADVFQRNTPQDFLDAAKMMLKASRTYILGSRASYGLAQHLFYLYHMVSLNGQLLSDEAGMLSDRVLQCQRGDVLVAISFEPYSKSTIAAVDLARSRGVHVLGLTDNQLSPLVGMSTRCLFFQSQTTSYFQSAIGAAALLECLAAACTIAGGRKAIEHLGFMQEHMKSHDAYW